MDLESLPAHTGEVARSLGEKTSGDDGNNRDEYKYFLRINRTHKFYGQISLIILTSPAWITLAMMVRMLYHLV